jgi:hypothetical protein
MDIGKILKEGIDVMKKSYVLAVPTVLATFAMTVLALLVVQSSGAESMLIPLGFISIVLNFFVHGVTLAMAREAIERGKTSLRTGLDVASALFFHFLVASAVMSALITVGFTLLILPGIAAMFFMMFAFPSIVMKGLGPLEALKDSLVIVKANLKDSFTLFIVMAGISFTVAVLNIMVGTIPMVGQFLNVIISGLVGGYFAVLLVKAYAILTGGAQPVRVKSP